MITFDNMTDAQFPEKGTSAALGLFDGMHPGHRLVIGSAVDMAQRHGLSPCVFTFSIHQSHPTGKPTLGRLYTPSIRDRLLADMGVEYTLCPSFDEFRGFSPQQYVEKVLHGILHARYLFCGDNYHFGKNAAGTVDDLRALCKPFGIEVISQPLVDIDGAPVSSTRIRSAIENGDMELASHLLGRPFMLDFEVIHGRQIGRTIQHPTINQALPDWFVHPRFGVYASITTVDGVRYPSVTNIGIKPTVGSDYPLAETCLIGYSGDLYGRVVPVEMYHFIRPEKKFDSIDALRQQIQQDSEASFEIASKL